MTTASVSVKDNVISINGLKILKLKNMSSKTRLLLPVINYFYINRTYVDVCLCELLIVIHIENSQQRRLFSCLGHFFNLFFNSKINRITTLKGILKGYCIEDHAREKRKNGILMKSNKMTELLSQTLGEQEKKKLFPF